MAMAADDVGQLGAANPVWTGPVYYEGGQVSPGVTYTGPMPGKANPDERLARSNHESRDLFSPSATS